MTNTQVQDDTKYLFASKTRGKDSGSICPVTIFKIDDDELSITLFERHFKNRHFKGRYYNTGLKVVNSTIVLIHKN